MVRSSKWDKKTLNWGGLIFWVGLVWEITLNLGQSETIPKRERRVIELEWLMSFCKE